MACSQTLNGILNDCLHSMGGIKEVYIANHSDVASVTVTDDKIDAIAMAASAKFKKFQFARQTGSMSSNYTIDETAGVNYVTTDIVMVFNRMETAKRIEITALAQAGLALIVLDNNGKYWYCGYDMPVRASQVDGLTGTAVGDRNGYSLTLQDNSQELPYEILVGDGGVDIDSIVG